MTWATQLLRRIGVRWIIWIALAYWLLASAYMLLAHGEELDFDSVFPFASQESGTTVSYLPTPANPPASVVAAFWAVGIVVGLPAVVSGRAVAIALRISTVAIGACLLVSILRLGILLAPVLALQLLALYRTGATRHS